MNDRIYVVRGGIHGVGTSGSKDFYLLSFDLKSNTGYIGLRSFNNWRLYISQSGMDAKYANLARESKYYFHGVNLDECIVELERVTCKSVIVIDSAQVDVVKRSLKKITTKKYTDEEVKYLALRMFEQFKAEFVEKMEKERESEILSLRSMMGITELEDDFIKIEDIKIICFGHSLLKKNEIEEQFHDVFESHFGRKFPNNFIQVPTLDYDRVKKLDVSKQLRKNIYDYLVAGPSPHNIKGKSQKDSYTTFAEKNKLKSTVYEINDKPMSKSSIRQVAKQIANDWSKKLNV